MLCAFLLLPWHFSIRGIIYLNRRHVTSPRWFYRDLFVFAECDIVIASRKIARVRGSLSLAREPLEGDIYVYIYTCTTNILQKKSREKCRWKFGKLYRMSIAIAICIITRGGCIDYKIRNTPTFFSSSKGYCWRHSARFPFPASENFLEMQRSRSLARSLARSAVCITYSQKVYI